MADTGGQEKTEPATPRRREEARQEGNVPKSTELMNVSILIAGVVMMYLYGPRTFERLVALQDKYLSNLHRIDISEKALPLLAWDIMKEVLLIVYPFALALIVTALAVNFAQVGFMLTGKPLQPKFSKLNPLEGIKRIFSARGAVDLVKSLMKIALVAPLMYWIILDNLHLHAALVDMPVKDILIHLGYMALKMVMWALLILLILALADFIFQRIQYERDLRMSKQEIKEELKRTQGDPQIKARIRQIQREVARRRMMAKVPEAEVVVTNPTEYAVALAYNREKYPAPVVLAKGQGLIAARIKEIAVQAGVPIFEDRPLAQALVRMVQVGDIIPPELYEGVARALAFVYRLQEKAKQRKKAAGF